MGLLDLDKLENLPELRNLNQLQNTQNLEQLQNLRNLQDLKDLQHLQNLNQLQYTQNLSQLDRLQQLSQLDRLELLSNMRQLEKLHHVDHLQQLQMLKRLDVMEQLGNLKNLHQLGNLDRLDNLKQLSQLDKMDQLPNLTQLQHMQNLNQLERLNQLETLNRLRVLDRLLDFNLQTLLYLSSVFVPGLIFQEAVSIFSERRVGFRRSLVLMTLYNVLSILICILFVYNYLNAQLLAQHPVYYYAIWFVILLALPFLLGWMVARLANASYFGRPMKALVSSMPAQAITNAWDRFLTEAESYQVVITLNNERKIMGVFRRGMPTPQTTDPDDLYFTETSQYDPQASEWKPLEHPTEVWVKGSEIKMVEVTPQA
ncbi:MAG TPA: DUF6338 family protein [Coleofasciculaceae cyanobacterium]|jgi:hypothetical protein